MRSSLPSLDGTFDHIEFLMVWLENHPLIPLSQYTFGSHLLDTRRAIAYEVIARMLAHLRSFVVNANICNKPGVGTALRCMLDVYALIQYLQTGERLRDEVILDKFLSGQQFATGSDYYLKREWSKDTGQPLPADVKKLLESWLGLPRSGLITKAAHNADEGFSALYAHYSEYVYFAVAGPRQEIEELYGSSEPSPFGSEKYFNACQGKGGAVYRSETRSGSSQSYPPAHMAPTARSRSFPQIQGLP